jgi:formamidopyrimidine-DNA glycosylase
VPELPEVETIVRGLRATVLRKTFLAIDVLREDLLATPRATFVRALSRRTISGVDRRGKNVVFTLTKSNGTAGGVLVVNLGMSGRLLRVERGRTSPLATHPGVRFALTDGSTLLYHDIRRFGRLSIADLDQYERWAASMGPEPLSSGFTSARLAWGLSRSSSRVHSWLLDQKRIAGIGNIYASEALFRARVHPGKRANELSPDEARRLHRAIRAVLADAVRSGGTTFRDYRTTEGEKGTYARALRVYARAGQRCTRCLGIIDRMVLGGRSAFYCPECQPSPDEAP